MRNVEVNPGGTLFNRTRQYVAHADDVILEILVRAIKEATTKLRKSVLKAVLSRNEAETNMCAN
jgi:hypothetical protein